MKIKTLRSSEVNKVTLNLLQICDEFSVAVAWAGYCDVVNAMLNQHHDKIDKIIIGTHFFQTKPDILRDFIRVAGSKFRCNEPTNKNLFHPKVYLFKKNDTRIAIIGSHNLTRSAFEKNIEFSIKLSWSIGDENQELRNIFDFIDNCFNNAIIPTNDFIADYESQYKLNKNSLEKLENFYPTKKPLANTNVDPVNLSWIDYLVHVRAERYNSIQERLKNLKCINRLFVNSICFSKMNDDERRAIAGTYHRGQPSLKSYGWGWFGGMSGNGCFASLILKNAVGISDALNAIPATGTVAPSHYNSFLTHFNNAFAGSTRQGGIPTASRLLAMKRPDVFVCINSLNKDNIYNAFGISNKTGQNSITLINYWDFVIGPIQSSSWWNEPRPLGLADRRIWENRTAMLDCIYMP